jgi:hypothetical protein
VRVNLIVVPEPRGQQRDDGGSVRQDRQSSIIPFERFDEGLGDAVRFGRADRREAQFEANHSTGCDALLPPNRRSTQATIRSRTLSPEMPALVADQAMISRSQASMANSTRTISSLRQESSK